MGIEVLILTVVQTVGKDTVTYVSGQREWCCASNTIEETYKEMLYTF